MRTLLASAVLAVTLVLATTGASLSESPPVFQYQWEANGSPVGVAFDATGFVYVANEQGSITKSTLNGVYVLSWGAAAPLGGIDTGPDGSVYVAEFTTGLVKRFTGGGQLLATFGSGVIYGAADVSVSATNEVYVLNYNNKNVEVYSPTGSLLRVWASAGGPGDGGLNNPRGIEVRGGHVYIVDTDQHRVQRFSEQGVFQLKWGTHGEGPGASPGAFNYPFGIDLDADGNVFIVDWRNHRVQKFDGAGTPLTMWGTQGFGGGRFTFPWGIGIAPDGRIFVADWSNMLVQVFGAEPIPVTPSSWSSIKRLIAQ